MNLSQLACQVYKELGGPQDRWPQIVWWHGNPKRPEEWHNDYWPYWEKSPEWLACPSELDALRVLASLGYIVNVELSDKHEVYEAFFHSHTDADWEAACSTVGSLLIHVRDHRRAQQETAKGEGRED